MPSRAPRDRLPVDERRAQLVSIGLALFTEQPYDEVSIDEVARRVGISKGLLYHYFSTKKQFYIACVRAAAREMQELTEPPPGGSVDELRTSLDAYLDYIEKRAIGYRTVLRASAAHEPELFELVETIRLAMIERILKGLGMTEPPALLRTALRGWLGFVEAASLDWIERRGSERARLRELLVETLVHSLAFAARPT
jgi:AcrR family transcriptional regulator